jgi:hypothetical protein
VTIVLRHNEALELNLVEYRDVVSLAELKALAQFAAANPEHMVRDGLAIVMPNARFSDVDAPALDALFAHYRQLYAPIQFQLLRRSAWICQSDAAAPQVRHWLSGDIREGMSSAVRQFDTIAEAGEWLVLSAAEIARAERREGFVEVARFEAPATGLAR